MFVDILTQMTLTTAHDSETPANGQQVITACAFIHQPFECVEKVFLPKRAATKKFLPGVFELPGGHIEFGEDPVAGLIREIKEEFEMDINVGDPFYVFTYTNQVKGSHSIEVIYFARFTSDISSIKLHPDDHSGYRWIAFNQLDQIANTIKGPDDPELLAIHRAFALLSGSTIDSG